MALADDTTHPHPGHVILSYPLIHKDGKAWATLRVQSRPVAPESVPHIVQGERVQGSFDLDLEEETHVKSINLSFTGSLTGNASTSPEFVRETRILWPAQEVGHLAGHTQGTHEGKLKGMFSWPFSLELPQTVDLPDEEGKTTSYPLPSSITSAWSIVNIAYKLEVSIKHGSLLHRDQNLSTLIVYITKSQPNAPSPSRQLAYQQEILPPGPEQDPAGWQVTPPVVFHGQGPTGHSVEVTYNLSLAKPLSYTRGTHIPLHLSISCSDGELLTALSSPSNINVTLRRICECGYDVMIFSGNMPESSTGWHKPLASVARRPTVTCVLQVQKAVWILGPSDDPDKRLLAGEIHLFPNLDPTTRLGLYSDTYTVVVSPPTVPGFSPSKDVLPHAYPVEICTMFAEGARPIAALPPTYDELQHLNEHIVTVPSLWFQP